MALFRRHAPAQLRTVRACRVAHADVRCKLFRTNDGRTPCTRSCTPPPSASAEHDYELRCDAVVGAGLKWARASLLLTPPWNSASAREAEARALRCWFNKRTSHDAGAASKMLLA